MKQLIAFILRLIIRTRYRINVESSISKEKLKGALIIPNHPAEIDPLIISTFLWPIAKPRPVVLESIFEMPVLRNIFSFIGAIAMPDMEQGSGFYKRKRIKQTLNNISNALMRGDNVLMYPSGRLSTDGREVIGGASGTYTILQSLTAGRVILIRSRGLWGSRFSKAKTSGARPEIAQAFYSGIKTICKNLIFFVPKRPVKLTIEEVPLDELKNKSLSELNSFLESWYGEGGHESALYISDSFLHSETENEELSSKKEDPPVILDEEKRIKILTHLAKISARKIESLEANLKLSEDLGLDSLTIAELVTWLHDEFHCADVELAELININSIFRAATNYAQARSQNASMKTPLEWTKTSQFRDIPRTPNCSTIAEEFIRTAKLYKNHPACSDARLGIKSYKDILIASLVLSKKFSKIPEQHIGIILPASAMSAIVTFACLLANKTPVFLNWTAGSRSLQHSIDLLSIHSIISAGAVLDTINQDLSPIEDKFLLLEEFKNSTSTVTKVISVLESMLPTENLIKYLKLKDVSEEQTAVVLFTSGSEAEPKGVPLSNRNILANIRSISEIFKFKTQDVVYGFLPPFHSFGLTVTTLMPLICGIRVSFYSNPNESRKIADGCRTWQVSLMAGTPAFIRGILSAGDASCFKQLRLLMSGADKLSNDIKEICKSIAPNTLLLEGYGITECSPVVCAQRPGSIDIGVGQSVPGCEIKIVNIETFASVPEGTQGLVLISGPNVFSGYIGSNKDPFIELNQTKWYNSGDLGYLSNRSLVLSGRLKRFIKIGGEMISLPAIEDALIKDLTENGKSPILAIVDSIDQETQRPLLTVFSDCANLNIENAQEILKSAGLPTLVKLHEVRYLKELPLLGTGKIDIQNLKRSLIN